MVLKEGKIKKQDQSSVSYKKILRVGGKTLAAVAIDEAECAKNSVTAFDLRPFVDLWCISRKQFYESQKFLQLLQQMI